MRCIKRNIGHLCHDEPRDAETKKSRGALGGQSAEEADPPSLDQNTTPMRPPSFDGGLGTGQPQTTKSAFEAAGLGRSNPLQLVQPTPASGMVQGSALSNNMNQCRYQGSCITLFALKAEIPALP
jgi:hypothetical protein